MKPLLNIFKLLTFLILIYLFFKFIDKENLFLILKQINIFELFLISIMVLSLILLITFRWHIIISFFLKSSFKETLNYIVQGSGLNILISSSLGLELTKILNIQKKIGKLYSLILILIDKLLILYFKVIFFFIFLLIYLIKYDFENNFFIFVSPIIIFLFLLLYNADHLIKILLTKINLNIYSKIYKIIKIYKKNILRLIVVNILIQIVNIIIYFSIFISINNKIEIFRISLFVPLIELFSQLQFLVIGARELGTIYLLNNLDVIKEISLSAALILTFLDILIYLIMLLFLNLKIFLK